MNELEKNLIQAMKISGLVRELRQSLELFEQGSKQGAVKKISSVEAAIEELNGEVLPEDEEAEEKLTTARENLRWVEDNWRRSE